MMLMKAVKSEEVVFGRGFVPVFATVFTGTEEEIARCKKLKESGERIHIIIDPTGSVILGSERPFK